MLVVEYEVDCLHVNIACRAAEAVAGEEDSALQDERVRVAGLDQPCQEPLQHVQGEKLLDRAALLSGHPLQCIEGLLRGHVRISSAVRNGLVARGKDCAISNNLAGRDAGRLSQFLNASIPVSYPAVRRNLNASTIERSAE